jgi:hypothetical protein
LKALNQTGPNTIRCDDHDSYIAGFYIVNNNGTSYSNATMTCCKPKFKT